VLRVQFDAARVSGTEIGVLDWIKLSNAGGGPVGPIAPSRFVARGVGDTQVNLSWDDTATNEQSFIVQRKLETDASFTTIATLAPNTEYFVDSAVTANTTYVYRVAALNPGGGGLSNEIRLSTWTADTFRWKTGAANPLARYESIGAAANGKLFVFGGYINEQIQSTARVDSYDPASNTWTQLSDMPEAVTHAGQAVDGRYIYIAGGFAGDHPGLGTTSVWRYDTAGDRWDRMPSLPAPRGGGAMARWGTELHFFGGLTRAQFATVNQAEHWVLDLTNPLLGWKTRAALPNARNHLAATELNGKIYAIGGQDLWNELTGAKANVDVYDPRSNTWTAAAALPVPRSHTSASTFSLNGKIYVVGGVTNALKTLRDVTVYNPATNTWTAMRELSSPRLTPVAGAIGKMLIVSTGSAYGLKPQAETWFGLLD
jgi:N-acetylneuraminic acid mutarotase